MTTETAVEHEICMCMDSTMNDALERFRASDWKRIQLDLTMYALYKVQRLRWRTAQGLPRGVQPEDLALGAIQKTFEGLISVGSGRGIRRWAPDKEPDLLEFLKSVVDSDVNSLVNLEEHKMTNYSATATQDEAAQILQSSVDRSDVNSEQGSHNPERDLMDRQDANHKHNVFASLVEKLQHLCSSDDDESAVLSSYLELSEGEGPMKPSAVAMHTGLSEERVRNAKRRIERKTRELREQIMVKSKGGELNELQTSRQAG